MPDRPRSGAARGFSDPLPPRIGGISRPAPDDRRAAWQSTPRSPEGARSAGLYGHATLYAAGVGAAFAVVVAVAVAVACPRAFGGAKRRRGGGHRAGVGAAVPRAAGATSAQRVGWERRSCRDTTPTTARRRERRPAHGGGRAGWTGAKRGPHRTRPQPSTTETRAPSRRRALLAEGGRDAGRAARTERSGGAPTDPTVCCASPPRAADGGRVVTADPDAAFVQPRRCRCSSRMADAARAIVGGVTAWAASRAAGSGLRLATR